MTQTTEHHVADLRDYIRVLRARKYQIALVALLVIAATMFFTFRQTPIYEGQAKVLVNAVQTPGTVTVPQEPNLDTERQLILSQAVGSRVERALHLTTPIDEFMKSVKVDVVTGTQVLVIRFDDPNPRVAATTANSFARAYIAFRTQQASAQFTAAASGVQQQIDAVQNRIATLNREIQSTTSAKARNTLLSQRDSLVAQLGALQQRLLDIKAQAPTAGASAQVVQAAIVPDSPASPNKVLNGVLALLVGVGLGVLIAFLRERLDDRIKSREELERRMGAPVLAAVPRVSGWRKSDEAQLIIRADPKNPVAEAYRTLATNIQYLASKESVKILMVTSSMGGEGKTTTTANLAVALAQAGRRVILLSADLRRPRIHRFFGLENRNGLSDVLSDSTPLHAVALDPGVPNLRLVNAGPVPNNPAQLLGSRLAGDFVNSLRDITDFVLIDTPPVLAVADASILAPLVDGTLFVMDAAHSSRSAMLQSRDQLETAGAVIIGTVYNNFDPGATSSYPYYYYNYYYQYYGTDEAAANGNGRKAVRRLRRSARRDAKRRSELPAEPEPADVGER